MFFSQKNFVEGYFHWFENYLLKEKQCGDDGILALFVESIL